MGGGQPHLFFEVHGMHDLVATRMSHAHTTRTTPQNSVIFHQVLVCTGWEGPARFQ